MRHRSRCRGSRIVRRTGGNERSGLGHILLLDQAVSWRSAVSGVFRVPPGARGAYRTRDAFAGHAAHQLAHALCAALPPLHAVRGGNPDLQTAQSRDALDGSKTVWAEVSDEQDMITVGNYSIPSRAYLGRFNFKGGDQQKFVKDLSGGERNRLHLAKTLKQGGNVLLLDEPTNDLDVETLRALEEALLAFPGTVLVISHDRWFLDRIATHILAYEGHSQAMFFEGNYTEYEEDRKKRLGGEIIPTRVKYRRLAD